MIDRLMPSGTRSVKSRRLEFVPDLSRLARELDDQDRSFVLFESTEPHQQVGRHSYLCPQPVWEVIAGRDGVQLRIGGELAEPVAAGGLELLEELLAAGAKRAGEGSPAPFSGGLAGFLSYELHELLEPASARQTEGRPVSTAPDFTLARFDWLIAIDVQNEQAWLIANGFGPDDESARIAAAELLDYACELVTPHLSPTGKPAVGSAGDWLDPAALGLTAATTREQYLSQVAEIQRRIVAGDVYEVCLSQQFEGPAEIDLHDLYRAVGVENPAPMSALMRLGGLDIVSASFERFLRIGPDRLVETRPVKGTRPRAADGSRDADLSRDLSTSTKDRAENVMAVDVARNDLGRVCDYGTVEVTELCAVESYRVTHQLVSTVRGKLFERMTPFDAVKAAFPGASMTGAPKIQAMRTIAQIEPVIRGIFAGSLLWAGYDGQLDASIVIRTFIGQDGRISLHVGGAVIADSVPEDEYDETLQKAQGMLRALSVCRTGQPLSAADGSAGSPGRPTVHTTSANN